MLDGWRGRGEEGGWIRGGWVDQRRVGGSEEVVIMWFVLLVVEFLDEYRSVYVINTVVRRNGCTLA